jgi:putative endonuclease
MVKMFYIYIVENLITHGWYIGFSTDIERRLKEHNEHIGGQYTKKSRGKWKLIYLEGYADKKDALGREKFLKSGAGRKYIKKQLQNYIERNLFC